MIIKKFQSWFHYVGYGRIWGDIDALVNDDEGGC